jgi:hypothetical protein
MILIPSVYLETTIPNYPFNYHMPVERGHTLAFFDQVDKGLWLPFTSEYVVDELEDTPDIEQREAMLAMINRYKIHVLHPSAKAERLAAIYIAEGIIPKDKETDAFHIATATVNGLSFILSYNFIHIANPYTAIMVGEINIREGYNRIGIYSPTEIITNAYGKRGRHSGH